jgi:hypothetical protein
MLRKAKKIGIHEALDFQRLIFCAKPNTLRS